MSLLSQFLQALENAEAVLVTVDSVRGSVPREEGAWMAVFAHTTVGTVGGGRLELDAMGHARNQLQQNLPETTVRYALGPSLGQCCGGEVHLRYAKVSASDIPALQARLAHSHVPVALFGGGHVGKALVTVLGTLPVRVTWIDSRDEIFPAALPDNVYCEHSDPVHAAVAELFAGTRVLIMSFSHAEDLDIVAACLARQRERADLPYIGLIGSKTKWASFRQRLLARGFTEQELSHVTCPIGIAGIADKRPEVIAVGVAAQLLQVVDSS
ncbi:xanthine dehydrogenase accessory protein XdhC [Rhodoferax saidenbachensis]|uniref:Xanthine dehydrogenase accessory protein XdhC n=1 Tax=Rhodoferax saidenbachensis TaxID=1484693 RepID=A0A1P8K7I8_9BURK|nr:xanthine dehydrogenase accessory protein XdhC [Rhodoferax saidenbachensis]APW41916.1 xanthine dehydrogenase accessory protein XdhC [Rhodoferax saidenbachensis]